MSMTIRALDASGDWTFGSGRQNYRTAQQAIELNIQTRIKSFLNDTFWNLSFGIDWWNILGQKNPSAQTELLIQCRSMIAGSYGVVKVNSLTASTNPARTATVAVNLDTIYSRNVFLSVQP